MGGKPSTRAKNKYNQSNYDNIRLIVKKGYKETIINYAKSLNLSTNLYITNLIKKDMEEKKKI